MPDHLDDMWKCPNPYGGCERTFMPSWHSHCPVCGSSKFPSVESVGDDHDQDGLLNFGSVYASAMGQDRTAPWSPIRRTDVEHKDHQFFITADTAESVRWPFSAGRPRLEDQEHAPSSASTRASSPDTVFSKDSSGTLATSLSMESASSLSREQIQAAIREFVSIVQLDQVLRPLYETARKDPKFGVGKLRKHVRKALKLYAEDLKGEAKTHLETSASQLVRVQAGHAARCVSNDFQSGNQSMRDADDSSDAETQGQPVDERQFDDLAAFRLFLTQSKAFAKLRAQTELFFSQKPTTSVMDDHVEEATKPRLGIGTLGVRLVLLTTLFREAAVSLVVRLLISLGCLEPPVEAGWTRIKLECHTCGERFFDDVPWHCLGGSIARLRWRMRRTLKATVTIVSIDRKGFPSNGRWQFPPWIYNTRRGITNTIQWAKSLVHPVLPLSNGPRLRGESQNPISALANASKLYIMSCVHYNWEYRSLLQDPVDHIKTDREFFAFLKVQVQRRRHHAQRILSCRGIKAVHFVKFKLRNGGMLEVRDHDRCCMVRCSCMPPNNSEYDFEPASNPSDWPIVLPKTLAHLLKDPDIAHENQNEISSWIPKRKDGELIVPPRKQSVEGWGLYFEEGWEAHDIITLIFIAFLASLVFLICWSVLKSDVSAAAGVSGYMMGALSVFIAMIVFRAQ